MQAMVLMETKTPLQDVELTIPQPQSGQVLIRIEACGVCRTYIFTKVNYLILGHQIVGLIAKQGLGYQHFSIEQRVDVP